MNSSSSDLTRTIAQISKNWAGLEKRLQPLKEIILQFNKVKSKQPQAELVLPFQDLIKKMEKATLPLKQTFKRWEEFQQNLAPFLEKAVQAIKQMPDNTRRCLEVLGRNGWYVSPDMPLSLPLEAALAFLDGKEDGGNKMMSSYFEEHLDIHRKEIVRKFPKRANVVDRAFEAHKKGWYELSIPVFLIQADGICFDRIELNLYKRKSRRPVIKKELERLYKEEFISILLHPLLIPLPISDPSKNLESFQGSVNRNAVLHGRSSDYGTHINSLKVVSHLSYVAWMFEDKIKIEKTTKSRKK